ncbi:hypothetical protein F5I97DRAFT_158441 [Phlebopus sp. FC_14]|nr:hypothetical protein F5I97DRAFT_158441 [Phlebopus sp. FC_14]
MSDATDDNTATALVASEPEPASTTATTTNEHSLRSATRLSPTSTPASPSEMILTSSPSSPQPPTVEQATDPRIALLKGMFPGFDDAVILSVLESTSDDQDRAIDILLGMSDPSYMPLAVHSDLSQFQQPSQEDLDEELARRLALEEEQAAARYRGAPDDPQRQTWSQGRQDVGYQSYQPRRTGGGWGTGAWGGWNEQSQPQAQGPQGQAGQRDTMTELQQGFNRIAESGRKTFSSVISKVRAKVQEFEQGQGWSGGGSNASPATSGYGQGGGYPQSTNQTGYTTSYPGAQGTYPQREGQGQPYPARTTTSSGFELTASIILRPKLTGLRLR